MISLLHLTCFFLWRSRILSSKVSFTRIRCTSTSFVWPMRWTLLTFYKVSIKPKPILSHIGYFISKLTYQSPGSQAQDSTKRQEAEVNKINIYTMNVHHKNSSISHTMTRLAAVKLRPRDPHFIEMIMIVVVGSSFNRWMAAFFAAMFIDPSYRTYLYPAAFRGFSMRSSMVVNWVNITVLSALLVALLVSARISSMVSIFVLETKSFGLKTGTFIAWVESSAFSVIAAVLWKVRSWTSRKISTGKRWHFLKCCRHWGHWHDLSTVAPSTFIISVKWYRLSAIRSSMWLIVKERNLLKRHSSQKQWPQRVIINGEFATSMQIGHCILKLDIIAIVQIAKSETNLCWLRIQILIEQPLNDRWVHSSCQFLIIFFLSSLSAHRRKTVCSQSRM